MDYITRTQAIELELPPDLWQKMDNISPHNMEGLISSIEISVSNGWMGVAAEITDQLEVTDYVDQNVGWRVRLET